MRVFGAILIVLGFLISLSIVGAFIGIPMILIGLVCLVLGGRRKTVITNVVQVSNVAPPSPAQDQQFMGAQNLSTAQPQRILPALQPMQRRLQTLSPTPNAAVIDAEFREERPAAPSYDQAKWNALVKYDSDIARIVTALQPYGQKYIDELAAAYLALNDKRYLGMIVQKVVADAKQERMAAQPRTATQRD